MFTGFDADANEVVDECERIASERGIGPVNVFVSFNSVKVRSTRPVGVPISEWWPKTRKAERDMQSRFPDIKMLWVVVEEPVP